MKAIIAFLIQLLFIPFIYSQLECNPEHLFMTTQENPQGLATDGNNFWVSSHDNIGNAGINIHDEFGNYIETIFPNGQNMIISGLELQMDTLWGVNEQAAKLYKMNKSTGEVYDIFELPHYYSDPNNWGIAYDGINLFVTEYGFFNEETSFLYKLNPLSGEVIDTIIVDLKSLIGVEINNGVMLGISKSINKLFEINLETGEFSYLLDWCLDFPSGIAFNPQGELFGISGRLNQGTQSVYRIDGIELNTNASILKRDVEVTIYPNPVREILKINIPIMNNGNLTIANSLGKVSLVDSFRNSYFEKNISALEPGIYYVFLKNGNNSIIKKFIKN